MVVLNKKVADPEHKPALVIRLAQREDAKAIRELAKKVYPDIPPYSEEQIFGQIQNFQQGQFIAEFRGKVVGYCATFRISGKIALAPHTWKEITGGGFASRHDPNGDYLYGLEVCVDPDLRGKKIGQRFYTERKKLCQYLRLKGIVFAGRIPGLGKKINTVKTPENYVKMVQEKKLRDPVLNFQQKNGFEIIGILKNYMESDRDSLGFAVHQVWRNPQETGHTVDNVPKLRRPDVIRLAAVQYRQRKVDSFEQFLQYVEYFVDVVSDYRADFVTFPELFTLQLLSLEKEALSPEQSIIALTSYTERIKKAFREMAIRYNVNIIGGSHPTKDETGNVVNVCYVFLRDGSIHSQVKIHPTPNERNWWNIKGGHECKTIMTDCGPIGILICYDSEFPELARHLVDQGAQILFVPFCTDERQSYLRVRYCAQARAVENQCVVVMAGNVGNLPGVKNMDIQYAQSCILTPCDFVFARDGIAADTTPNVEMVAVADIRPENILSARHSGTVQNVKDRRFDLYSVKWKQTP